MKMKDTLGKVLPLARLKAPLRAKMQEREAARSLSDYRRRARGLGISEPTGEQLAQLLRERVAGRPHPTWPKRMGGIHLFLAYPANDWEDVLKQGLACFGSVTAFEWRGMGFDDTAPDWLARRDEMNEAMLTAFARANLLNPVDAVVGYLSGYNTSPRVLVKMAQAGAAIFNFCWDDVLNFPGKVYGGRYTSVAAIASAVDLNLTNVPANAIKYMVHGGLALFLPEAAEPTVHRPANVPFKYDVSFVGACYGWRPKFMRALSSRGIYVECFGRGWRNGAVTKEEMVELYSRSRICLGFSTVGHSKRLHCLKGRDFEVPMSGGLYLTGDHEDLHRVFRVGEEVLSYSGVEDCAAKIGWVMDHPDRAATIRRAGRLRSLQDHTYKARWVRAFQAAGIVM